VIQTENYDVAIIGGGPAGAAAAIATHSAHLSTCLIDEQPRLGGQIYRQPPAGYEVDSWLADGSYAEGKSLIARAERLDGLRHIAPATVCALFPARPAGNEANDSAQSRLHIVFHDNHRLGRVAARSVLLATGCYEMPVPFPGWHLPGVMGAGGIQTLLKSQRVAAGSNILLAGSHPLLFVVAEQLLAADIRIAGIALAQQWWSAAALLRSPLVAWTGRGHLVHTLKTLASLRRAGIPIFFGETVVEALGQAELEAVRLRDPNGKGKGRVLACDALGISYGFLPSSELARQAGAHHAGLPGGGWVIAADEFMRSSVAGLYVAGELTGVAGAAAAALSGEIAGIGIAMDSGRVSAGAAHERTRHLSKRLAEVRRFAAVLARLTEPTPRFLAALADRSTLLCRCEDVTVGQMQDALDADPQLASASSAKLRTRTGMGFCQGRMCELSVRRLLAARRNCRIEEVPGYTIRPPVKPLPIGVLAGDPGALDIDPSSASAGATPVPAA
jgi:thioredoxin reductase